MGFMKKLFNSPDKTISILEADSMLKRTNELANVANKTTDRDEFYRSINEIKSILRELSKYEGKLPFIGSPSSDLRNLEQIEQKQIELLEKRIGKKGKNTNNERKVESIPKENPIVHKNIPIDGMDALFYDAGRFIIEKDMASIGILQRAFKIGFNRAARIMDQLTETGVVGEEEGTKPRKILMNESQFEQFIEEYISNDIFKTAYSDKSYVNKIDLYNNQYDYMEGHDFEYFCADILRKNGFENVEVTQGSGDHGIDILAEKDGISYAIQCKRYDKPIGNSAIQQAIAGKGIYKRDIAVVLTNQYFSPQAIQEANILGVKLWDRNTLNEMINNQL